MPPIQYIVEGGHRLAGTIEPSGNKNAALPIIAAALLTAAQKAKTPSDGTLKGLFAAIESL